MYRSMFQNGLNWCDMQATLVTALMDPNMKQTLETVREYTLKIDHKITCPLVRSLRFVPKNEALGPHEGGKHWDSVLLLLDTFDAGVFFYDVALFITQGKGVNFDKTSADYTFSVENLFPIAQRDDIGIVLSVTPDINKIGRRQKVVTGVRIVSLTI